MKSIIKKSIYYLLLATLVVCYTGCRKDKHDQVFLVTGTNHSQLPDTNALLPGEFIFDNLSWQKDSFYTSSGFNPLYSLSDFDPFKNIIPNEDYDTSYYKDHVRVSIRFTTWVTIPYAVLDRNGLPNHDIYFVSNNYILTLPMGGVQSLLFFRV